MDEFSKASNEVVTKLYQSAQAANAGAQAGANETNNASSNNGNDDDVIIE